MRLLRSFGACNGTKVDIKAQPRERGWAFRVNRAKLIHTFHGHIFEGYFNPFLTKIFILIEKALACFTSKIITVTEEVKKEIVSLGIAKAKKIAVIPLGLELERFLGIAVQDYPVTLAKAGVGNDTAKVGIVGRLVPVKNHRLFLEAARDCFGLRPRNDGSFKFKIVGDGELRGELEGYARKLGLDGCVEFSGWQKDLPEVYSDLDVVCLTSLNEGTPVSLIEAMACGRAVVATEVGGVADLLGGPVEAREGFVVRERGLSVKPIAAAGFARVLTFALENKGVRETLAKSAREYVKAAFSKERLIRDIEDLYDSERERTIAGNLYG